MRIIFLMASRNFGGAQRSTLEHAKRLANIHEVKFIELEGKDKLLMNTLKNENIDCSVYEKQLNTNTFLSKINAWYKWKIWLNSIIKDWKPDVVVVKDVKTLSLLMFNETYEVLYHAHAWYASYQISLFKQIVFKLIKPKFIAISEATRHAIFNAKLAKLNQIAVIPNALSFEEKEILREQNISDRVRLLHVGGYLPGKGMHTSIKIAKKLRDLGISFELSLVGFKYDTRESREYHSRIINEIKNLGLEKQISVYENKENIEEYYIAHDILLYPSKTEGLPRVVMEAMYFKMIVISNPVGGVIDLIQNFYTGFLAEFDNVDSFVDYVKFIIKRNGLFGAMGNRAHSLIRDAYSVDMQMKRFDRIFSNEINSKRL